MSVTIQGDEKLYAINCFPIDVHRRKQLDEPLNAVEHRSFRSVNSFIGWLGANAPLFVLFALVGYSERSPRPWSYI